MAKPFDLIAACSLNRVIGRDGCLPWHLRSDLDWLVRHTRNRCCILGRRSYEAWPSIHKEGRLPIVVTSGLHGRLRPHPRPETGSPALQAASFRDALDLAESVAAPTMVCGGTRLYEEALPHCRRLYLTEVLATIEGNAFFPDWRELAWNLLECTEGAEAGLGLRFSILERIV